MKVTFPHEVTSVALSPCILLFAVLEDGEQIVNHFVCEEEFDWHMEIHGHKYHRAHAVDLDNNVVCKITTHFEVIWTQEFSL